MCNDVAPHWLILCHVFELQDDTEEQWECLMLGLLWTDNIMLPVYNLYPTADVHNKATAILQMKISKLSRSDGLIARQVENESFETASSSP